MEKVRIPAMLNADQTKAAGKTVAMQGVYVYRIAIWAREHQQCRAHAATDRQRQQRNSPPSHHDSTL